MLYYMEKNLFETNTLLVGSIYWFDLSEIYSDQVCHKFGFFCNIEH